jgi:hypothetical protein
VALSLVDVSRIAATAEAVVPVQTIQIVLATLVPFKDA